jgi:hypothetical protein
MPFSSLIVLPLHLSLMFHAALLFLTAAFRVFRCSMLTHSGHLSMSPVLLIIDDAWMALTLFKTLGFPHADVIFKIPRLRKPRIH